MTSEDVHIELLTRYWFEQQNAVRSRFKGADALFVGDCHGDINQVLLPLIATHSIEIIGGIEVLYEATIPKFICKDCSIPIYFLGDYVEKWILSRNVIAILRKVMKECKNVYLCIGNHDAWYISRTPEEARIKILKHAYLEHKQMQLYNEHIRVVRHKLTYDGSEEKFVEFINDYYRPLFEGIRELFDNERMQVCFQYKDIVVSHTILSTEESSNKLEEINKAYKSNPKYFCKTLWNRSGNPLFKKQIIGHTPPMHFEHINGDAGLWFKDRIKKTITQNVNGCSVYFCDLGASAGMNGGHISTPDYFYMKDGKMMVSNEKPLLVTYIYESDVDILFTSKTKDLSGATVIYAAKARPEQIIERISRPYEPNMTHAIKNLLVCNDTHFDTYGLIQMLIRDSKKYKELKKQAINKTGDISNNDYKAMLNCIERGIDPEIDLQYILRYIDTFKVPCEVLYISEFTDKFEDLKVGDTVEFKGLTLATPIQSLGIDGKKYVFALHNQKAALLRTLFDDHTVYRINDKVIEGHKSKMEYMLDKLEIRLKVKSIEFKEDMHVVNLV